MARILVVEDYPPISTVVRVALSRNGHEVVQARCAVQALNVSGAFDLAVCDFDLPDGDGVELARQLLSHRQTRSVVFYTASSEQDALERAWALGHVVAKEDGIHHLTEVVEAELGTLGRLARAVGAPERDWERPTGRSGTRRRVT